MLKPQQWAPVANKLFLSKRCVAGLGSAPLKEELEYYRKYLKIAFKGKNNPRVLVLGATPELRDLALQMGAEVVAVDFNLDVILSMAKVCKEKDRRRESVIKADWMEVPLKNSSFDAVIGDAAFNNVSCKDYPRLLKNVFSWLKPGGYLVIREMILPEKNEFRNFRDVINDFLEKKISLPGIYLRMRFMCFHRKIYSQKTKTLSGNKVFEALDKELKNGTVPKSLYNILNSRRNKVSHTIFRNMEYKRLLGHFFKILEMSPAVKDRGGFYPLFMVFAEKK